MNTKVRLATRLGLVGCLCLAGCPASGPATADKGSARSKTPSRPRCRLVLGPTITSTPWTAGARDGARIYLASGHTLRVFKLDGERLSQTARYEVPRSDPAGPVSSEIEHVWARGKTVVVGTDSFIRLLGWSGEGALTSLGGQNHHVASIRDRSVVVAGGQGIASHPLCQAEQACKSGRVLRHSTNAYDLVVEGSTAYVLDRGESLSAFELTAPPRLLGTLPISEARTLARVAGHLIVSTDAGLLHVVDTRRPSRMQVVDTVFGVAGATRLRAFKDQVWAVGGDAIGLFALRGGAQGHRLHFLAEHLSRAKSARDPLESDRLARICSPAAIRPSCLARPACARSRWPPPPASPRRWRRGGPPPSGPSSPGPARARRG